MIKLALSGYAQSGKSTVADYLNEVYGFDIFAFAHNLKVDLINMDVPPETIKRKPWPLWLRKLAQLYGVSRRDEDENYWVTRCLDDIEDADPEAVVVDDLRFPNEARALRENGFTLIRVVKAGYANTDPHVSETALDDFDDWDYIVFAEDGDLIDLFTQVDQIIAKEERRGRPSTDHHSGITEQGDFRFLGGDD